jgi:hypothetical protein
MPSISINLLSRSSILTSPDSSDDSRNRPHPEGRATFFGSRSTICIICSGTARRVWSVRDARRGLKHLSAIAATGDADVHFSRETASAGLNHARISNAWFGVNNALGQYRIDTSGFASIALRMRSIPTPSLFGRWQMEWCCRHHFRTHQCGQRSLIAERIAQSVCRETAPASMACIMGPRDRLHERNISI